MKNYWRYIYFSVVVFMFVGLALFKSDIMEYVSKGMSSQMSESKQKIVSSIISDKFDYTDNGLQYSYTFLEFGSVGCSICRQMQSVMETIRSDYSGSVNVVFVNVAEAENIDIVNYYGIVSIPTQVLLDNSGKEYYRHSGYISAEDLSEYFKKE